MRRNMKEQWICAVLLFASVATTCVNEQRLMRSAKSMEEGLRVVVSLPEPVSVPQNDGKLVHFSGLITTDPTTMGESATVSRTPYVLDPVFGIATRGVRLLRTVEMLQWVETAHTSITGTAGGDDSDRSGGIGSEQRDKTYMYDLRWRSERVDSSRFNDISYQNPPEDTWVYRSKVIDAEAVVVGDFKLSHELVDQIQRKDAVELDAETLRMMRNVLNQRVGSGWETTSALKEIRSEDGHFYLLDEGVQPRLGDLRVSFTVTPAYQVTISGKQDMQHIRPYPAKAGEPLLLLEDGTHSANELYNRQLAIKLRHNRFYRLFAATLGFIGFLVIHPWLTLRLGIAFARIQKHMAAASFSCGVTFAVAGLNWLPYRPLWALVLVLGGLAPSIAVVAFVQRARRIGELTKTD